MTNGLANLDRARMSLAEAHTLSEVKKIRDMAEAARTYAKAAHMGRESQNYAAEIALLASRKAGEILRQLERDTPQKAGAKKAAASVAAASEYRKALDETNTPERTAPYWQKLAAVSEKTFIEYVADHREQGEITSTGLLKAAKPHVERRKNRNEPPEDADDIQRCALKMLQLGYEALRKSEPNHSLLVSARTWAECKLARGVKVEPIREDKTTASPLQFVEVEKRQATELIIQNHYLHRKCPISWSWGIEVNGEIAGVLTIGKPCSWSATCGVVGEKREDVKNPAARSNDVYELNRLWVSDALPRNTESQFVGWCLRQLRKLHPNIILISYADGSQQNPDGLPHVGYVYQATNWIYTGASAAFTDISFQGYSDCRSVPVAQRGEKVGRKRGWASNPDAIRTKRTAKHRYVWFGNPADEKFLAWARQPYPKKAA